MIISDEMVGRAAAVFCDHGIDITCPWEADLDDLERERYEALRAALEAAIGEL